MRKRINSGSSLVLACLIGGAAFVMACGGEPPDGSGDREAQTSAIGSGGQAPPTASNVNSGPVPPTGGNVCGQEPPTASNVNCGPGPSTSSDPKQAHADCLNACQAAGESPKKCQAGCDLGRARLECFSRCINIGHDKDLCVPCVSGGALTACYQACTAGGGSAKQCTDDCVAQTELSICYKQCLRDGGSKQTCQADCYV